MWFVVLGVLLIVLNLLGVGPLGEWQWPGDWWKMCWPFGLALLWWTFADKSGYTKRRQMEKMDERQAERRRRNMDALGLDARKREQVEKRGKNARAFGSTKLEKRVAETNAKNKATLARSSRLDGQASSQFDERK